MDSLWAVPTRKWVSKMASPRPLPAIFTIELLAKPLQASFPLIHGGGHTTNVVGVVSHARLQAPPVYNNGARKHTLVRGMQTS
jgi:hypothetical protein